MSIASNQKIHVVIYLFTHVPSREFTQTQEISSLNSVHIALTISVSQLSSHENNQYYRSQ